MIFFLVIYNLNKYQPNLTKGLNNNESNILILLYVLFILKIIQRESTNICEICILILIFVIKIELILFTIKSYTQIRIKSLFKNKAKQNIKSFFFFK